MSPSSLRKSIVLKVLILAFCGFFGASSQIYGLAPPSRDENLLQSKVIVTIAAMYAEACRQYADDKSRMRFMAERVLQAPIASNERPDLLSLARGSRIFIRPDFLCILEGKLFLGLEFDRKFFLLRIYHDGDIGFTPVQTLRKEQLSFDSSRVPLTVVIVSVGHTSKAKGHPRFPKKCEDRSSG